MYDPHDFRHGIEVLMEAVSRGDAAHRKSILDIMLLDLEVMKGNAHDELISYIAGLSLFPDDAVDFPKLSELHHVFAATWASSTSYELEKEQQRVEVLLPVAQKHIAAKKKESEKNQQGGQARAHQAQLTRQAITDWVDKYLSQRAVAVMPSASDLATRLLKHGSDFKWPEGCKPLGHDRIRKTISSHLKQQ